MQSGIWQGNRAVCNKGKPLEFLKEIHELITDINPN